MTGIRTEYQTEKQSAWQAQSEAARTRLAGIRAEYATAKAVIEFKIDPRQHAERRAALSVVRMQRVEKEKAASTANKTERADLKASQNLKNADLYRVYLTKQAQAGNAAALGELRLQQKHGAEPVKGSIDALTAEKGAAVKDAVIIEQPKITYNVSDRGDVTYKRDGEPVMRDVARAVVMIQTDAETIETGLRLGMAKFGRELTVNGTDDFQRRAVEIAVERRINVIFKTEVLQQYQQHLQQQKSLPLPPTTPSVLPPTTVANREPMQTTTKPSINDTRNAYRAKQLAEIAKREQEAAAARKQVEQAKMPKTPGHGFSM